MKRIFKIISLSSFSAGLSSLFSKYCYQSKSTSPKGIYDIRIDHYLKEIVVQNGLNIILNFWKLYFRARFNFFLPKLVEEVNPDAGLLMFDITSKNSLYNIEMYIPIFRLHDPTLPIILLGNKVDLVVEKSIEQEYLKKYLSRNNITFYYEISVKEDTNKNIDLMFSEIAQLIFNRRK